MCLGVNHVLDYLRPHSGIKKEYFRRYNSPFVEKSAQKKEDLPRQILLNMRT
jgi:hypothetical protein